MHRLLIIALSLFMSLLYVTTGQTALASLNSEPRVFLLYSYHPTFPTPPQVYKGLLEGFGENPPVIEIEYMDSKRLYDDKSIALFRQSLTYKLSKRLPYDVVVTADDNALNFMLKYGEELFPDTPVVFLGVNNRELAKSLNEHPTITGVVEAASIDETIEWAKRLRPKMQKLHIITDATPSGQSDLRTTLTLKDDFPSLSFNVIDLSDIKWSKLTEILHRLPTEDGILLLSAYWDTTNDSLSFNNSLKLITRWTNTPIFHPYEHGMGDGVLGGVMISHHEQARQAAFKVKQILMGAPVHSIPVLTKSPNVPIFDRRELDRFEIPTSLLPENAEIRYYQPPFFVKYWLEITTVAFIMFLMTLIIIILARQNRMRLQLTRSISENESKLRTILDNVDAYIYMKDATGRYLFANQSLCSFLGLPLDEIISKTDEDLFDKETAKQIIKADDETFGTGNIYKKEETFWPSILNRRQEIQTTKIPLMDEDGVAYALCGISLDITSQKAQEKKLKHIAHYDQLTELPNRILFSDRLQQAMKHADRDKSKITILYFDLDGFKEVNDNYGHSHGDQLLKTIAERTKDAIRSNDTVARLGGDEFIVLLINAKEPEDDLEVIHRLLDSISDPVVVDGNVLSVTASIGVTNYPQNSSIEADLLLRQADQAMYAAKSEGRNRYHFFDSATEKIAVQQEKLFSEISNGLRQNEFRLFYQPKVDLINGDVIGMEALIRWEHPEKGLLPPGAFLPDVEQHSLMIDIDQWVVRESLRQLDSWRKQELALPVSVNASHLYFKQDSLSFIVKEELKKFPDLNASLLELEIVESQALDNLEGVARKIRECQRLGVRFALDDFGTGFSSLTYLKQLPINILKVDSSFVIDMLDDEEDRMILQGILALCEAFNIKVIAEGLETIQHGIELKNMGYRYAQGYGIAKPMPAEEIIDWINSWQAPREWETPSYYLQDSQE